MLDPVPPARRAGDRQVQIQRQLTSGELTSEAAIARLFDVAHAQRDALHAWIAAGAPLRRATD